MEALTSRASPGPRIPHMNPALEGLAGALVTSHLPRGARQCACGACVDERRQALKKAGFEFVSTALRGVRDDDHREALKETGFEFVSSATFELPAIPAVYHTLPRCTGVYVNNQNGVMVSVPSTALWDHQTKPVQIKYGAMEVDVMWGSLCGGKPSLYWSPSNSSELLHAVLHVFNTATAFKQPM